MSITFTKKSLWVNQAPCFNFELNEDELLDKALKENFVIKIEEDLYELNLDHNSFENVRHTDEEEKWVNLKLGKKVSLMWLILTT